MVQGGRGDPGVSQEVKDIFLTFKRDSRKMPHGKEEKQILASVSFICILLTLRLVQQIVVRNISITVMAKGHIRLICARLE